MWQFVPLSDDMLYGAGGTPGPLVPYRSGVACWRALSDVAQPQAVAVRGAAADREAQRCTDSVSPGFTPSFSATPALSSSTYCAAPLDG